MNLQGYKIDANIGVVYGLLGNPIRKKCRGYVWVLNPKRGVHVSVHRWIWESVNGIIPEGLQINHKNGVKTDNRIDNLELVTQSENTLHAYKTGLASAVGVRNGRAKLTPEIAELIRNSSASHASLSRLYCVSVRSIRQVRDGKSWRHL